MIKRFEGLEGRKGSSERSPGERGEREIGGGEVRPWHRDWRVWAEQTGIEKEELIKIQIP